MATQKAASGDASHIAVSTSVPRVSTATFSRFTTVSFVLVLARRSAPRLARVCSATTTRARARRRSALAA